MVRSAAPTSRHALFVLCAGTTMLVGCTEADRTALGAILLVFFVVAGAELLALIVNFANLVGDMPSRGWGRLSVGLGVLHFLFCFAVFPIPRALGKKDGVLDTLIAYGIGVALCGLGAATLRRYNAAAARRLEEELNPRPPPPLPPPPPPPGTQAPPWP